MMGGLALGQPVQHASNLSLYCMFELKSRLLAVDDGQDKPGTMAELSVWELDPNNRVQHPAITTLHQGVVRSVLVVPERHIFLIGDSNGVMTVWQWQDTEQPACRGAFHLPFPVCALCYCEADQTVWCGGIGSVYVLALDWSSSVFELDPQCLVTLEAHGQKKVNAIVSTPLSPSLWSVGDDGSLAVWSIEKRRLASSVMSESRLRSIVASSIAALPFVWTGSATGSLCMWAIPANLDHPPTLIYTLKAHVACINSLQLRESYLSTTLLSLDPQFLRSWLVTWGST